VSELTAEGVREHDLAVLELQREPGELYSVEDVEAPGPAGTLLVRVYRPRPERLHPVLFLHGGGFVLGRAGYDAPLRELALASGCLIVSPECRLAPEHPFPAAADDALAAARWLNAEASALGATHAPPAVAGDSSGGNLAATVTLVDATDVVLGSARKNQRGRQAVGGVGCESDALSGDLQRVDCAGARVEVLDREAGGTGLSEQRHGFAHSPRVVRIAALAVDVQGQIGRLRQARHMGHELGARDALVEPAERPREPRAGGRERLEANRVE